MLITNIIWENLLLMTINKMMFQSTLNFQCYYQASSILHAFYLVQRQKVKNLISSNLIHEAGSFISSTSYAKEVVVTEIFHFFHQQIWQEDFAGGDLLMSTNLELLPVVFLSQADSVRLSTWLIGFF